MKIKVNCVKRSLWEYSLITNKHNQKLINILENQKINGGFLKILIFRISLSRTHLQSETQNVSILRKLLVQKTIDLLVFQYVHQLLVMFICYLYFIIKVPHIRAFFIFFILCLIFSLTKVFCVSISILERNKNPLVQS